METTSEKTYFLDTYALVEISRENKNFKKFEETQNFTNLLNLLELHYSINKDFGIKKANEIIDKLRPLVIDIEVKDIKEASIFRTKNKGLKFSYIDCLGYIMALNRNMKFVTGDSQFEGLSNVEFVK